MYSWGNGSSLRLMAAPPQKRTRFLVGAAMMPHSRLRWHPPLLKWAASVGFRVLQPPYVFIELHAAIEELGGQLTDAQHQKFESADAARRRFVAQMQWAVDPPAVPAWRTPRGRRHPQAHVLRLPHGRANSDGMPPVGVAVARSIRNAISRSNRASGSEGIASAPLFETITPRRLRRRGLVVVGQPLLGRQAPKWFTQHGPELRQE